MERLTNEDIQILEEKIKSGKLFQVILRALFAGALLLFALSFYFNWESPASFFIGFFGFGFLLALVIFYFIQRKVRIDLAVGIKTLTEGTISKKEMSKGNSYYNYSMDSLLELAEYIENKEKGIKIDYGIKEWQLREGANANFEVLVDAKWYDVGIRNYIALAVDNTVRIIYTPKSGTVLSVEKVSGTSQVLDT